MSGSKVTLRKKEVQVMSVMAGKLEHTYYRCYYSGLMGMEVDYGFTPIKYNCHHKNYGYNIYFVVPGDIEIGDWFIETNTEFVAQADESYPEIASKEKHRKIIASSIKLPNTDDIPLIPFSYISKYVREKRNDKKIYIQTVCTVVECKPLVTDGYVTIFPYKTSWNQEDVKNALWEAFKANKCQERDDIYEKVLYKSFLEWYEEHGVTL